jgi:hypothetical protein
MANKPIELMEIPETDVALIAQIYNDCASKIDPFRYRLNLKGDFTKKPWYNDLVKLIRLMVNIGVKPRTYIHAQFVEYRKPMFKARRVPTIRMMTTPSGIDRYNRYCEEIASIKDFNIISKEEMDEFSQRQMEKFIQQLNIPSEEDFFKDLYLLTQLSRSFVKNHPIFKKLVREGYYQKVYGVSPDAILP